MDRFHVQKRSHWKVAPALFRLSKFLLSNEIILSSQQTDFGGDTLRVTVKRMLISLLINVNRPILEGLSKAAKLYASGLCLRNQNNLKQPSTSSYRLYRYISDFHEQTRIRQMGKDGGSKKYSKRTAQHIPISIYTILYVL